MNWIDLVIVGGLGLAALSGYRRGAVMQVFSWGGFFLGMVFALFLAPPLIRALPDQDSPAVQLAVGLGVFLVMSFIVEAVVAYGGSRLMRRITHAGARHADRVGGVVVGSVMALLLPWFLSLPAKQSPALAAAINDSAILDGTYAILETPPDLFATIGRFLDNTPFPEVFAGINPSLAPGVEPAPASLRSDREILAAARLTYKISGRGCEGLVNGSGFPVTPNTLITAAHVVAGTHDTVVLRAADAGGGSFRATVVYMDTDTDIAVLRASSLPRRDLDVASRGAERRTEGAAIGYPGGGKRTISPARVRTRTEALGYDIYSRKRVKRQIYVLRAGVKQGNSGGPFVDGDGVVRGMIFAASSENANESYALSEDEIFKALRNAGDRRRGVDTGECAV